MEREWWWQKKKEEEEEEKEKLILNIIYLINFNIYKIDSKIHNLLKNKINIRIFSTFSFLYYI